MTLFSCVARWRVGRALELRSVSRSRVRLPAATLSGVSSVSSLNWASCSHTYVPLPPTSINLVPASHWPRGTDISTCGLIALVRETSTPPIRSNGVWPLYVYLIRRILNSNSRFSFFKLGT